jgi:hypothetical protein
MTHNNFFKLLREAVVCQGQTLSSQDRKKDVRVQWDPERGPALGMHPYRSIQIGISGTMAKWWVEEGIVGIEDVTEKAKELYDAVNENKDRKEKMKLEEYVERGLVPMEKEFAAPEEVRVILRMDEDEGGS